MSGKKLTVTSYTLNSAIVVPLGTINDPPSGSNFTKVTTDNIDNKIYQNSSLKQIQTSEGYSQGGVYYYYLKDHLGNTRAIINSSGTIIEKSHYYPFGMRFYPESSSNSNAIAFRYNGKEYDSMNGLNHYDYGARFYDPALGRWHTPDPLAEKYFSLSPYCYAANNPIKFIDSDGKDILIWYKNDNGQMNSYRYTGGSISHSNSYVNKVATAWNYNVSNGKDNGGGKPSYEAATNRNITINVRETDGASEYVDKTNTVYWNPELGTLNENGTVTSPASDIDHELDHGVQHALNPIEYNKDSQPNTSPGFGKKEEERVITGSEQKTARANGEIKKNQITRTSHSGQSVITEGVTSTKINQKRTDEFNRQQEKRAWDFLYK
jgi:RHS repeat-associated protein